MLQLPVLRDVSDIRTDLGRVGHCGQTRIGFLLSAKRSSRVRRARRSRRLGKVSGKPNTEARNQKPEVPWKRSIKSRNPPPATKDRPSSTRVLAITPRGTRPAVRSDPHPPFWVMILNRGANYITLNYITLITDRYGGCLMVQ